MVRMEGIEPPRLAALEPKSSASTSSATCAHSGKYLSRYKPHSSGAKDET